MEELPVDVFSLSLLQQLAHLDQHSLLLLLELQHLSTVFLGLHQVRALVLVPPLREGLDEGDLVLPGLVLDRVGLLLDHRANLALSSYRTKIGDDPTLVDLLHAEVLLLQVALELLHEGLELDPVVLFLHGRMEGVHGHLLEDRSKQEGRLSRRLTWHQ